MMDQDFNSTGKTRSARLLLSNAERMKRYSENGIAGALVQREYPRAWFFTVKIGIDVRVQGHMCVSSKLLRFNHFTLEGDDDK